jgi:hypothetical protein
MEYAALTFWMLVIVFSAMGVHRLWSSLLQPKVVNSILLPGTLVATLGHVLGLLVTGGTVNNTSLVKDDDTGEPQTGTDEPKSRIPVVGTIIIALLPMIGCAIAIYWVSAYFGSEILGSLDPSHFDRLLLPTSLSLFFTTLRELLTLVERLVDVIWASDLTKWQSALFLYLVVCLTVRMAPLTGNIRGALGAIFLTGVIAFLVGQIMHPAMTQHPLQSAWPLVTFCVAVSILLLMISLIVTGIVGLVKTVVGSQ